MRTGLFFVMVGLSGLCSCTLQQKNAVITSGIKKADWLIGTWENKTTTGTMYETWTKLTDDELSGKGYVLKEMDTLVFETIRLVHEHHGLFYIPTVKSQNDNLPVRFALKTISDTKMVFENPNHDFPQVISYTKISADSLVAEISGIKDGLDRNRTFPMKRENKSATTNHLKVNLQKDTSGLI
jgi:hypothetical protein